MVGLHQTSFIPNVKETIYNFWIDDTWTVRTKRCSFKQTHQCYVHKCQTFTVQIWLHLLSKNPTILHWGGQLPPCSPIPERIARNFLSSLQTRLCLPFGQHCDADLNISVLIYQSTASFAYTQDPCISAFVFSGISFPLHLKSSPHMSHPSLLLRKWLGGHKKKNDSI